MKKVMFFSLIFIGLFLTQWTTSQAEEIVYPFDSIKITSAFTFNVLIEEAPLQDSILFGNVAVDEVVEVYVGNLEFVLEGVPVQGSGSIIILTNEADEDFVAWLLNGSSGDTNNLELKFGSWITIDPEVGVVKDFSNGNMEVGYNENLVSNEFTFIDNLNVSYDMVADSYFIEESLDIIISAYVEVE